MEVQKYVYKPEVRVCFTFTEVGCMFAAAETHYDSLCKMQAKQGGLLWAMRNMLILGEGEPRFAEICLDSGQIDLLLKITQDRYVPLIAIHEALKSIFDGLQKEFIRLNP